MNLFPTSVLTVPKIDLGRLSGPICGLFGEELSFRPANDKPMVVTRMTYLGDLSEIWSHLPQRDDESRSRYIAGMGVGLQEDEATLPSRAEALERYCCSAYHKEQFVTATANELGDEALDLNILPRCSENEFAHPHCPLVAPSKTAPIRWVRGLSLLTGRMTFIPVVLTYLHTGFIGRDERICMQISTGCAAHASLEKALLSGIFEVVERDAIALVWLQRLGLPQIEIDYIPRQLAPYWESYQQSSKELTYNFFDATTDVGIPTVYGVQRSRCNRRLTTMVACSTAPTLAEAIVKVIRDLTACGEMSQIGRKIPESFEDFTELFHGAAFMARAEQASAFDFLLNSGCTRKLSEVSHPAAIDEHDLLELTLHCLREMRMDVYAVELSTDEVLHAGMRVVRVIIPALQPFGFHYRARYLGHPRLYEAPARMGYAVHQEKDLNHLPQPFA